MRFVQFYPKDDHSKQIRLGVLSENDSVVTTLNSKNEVKSDMKDFITKFANENIKSLQNFVENSRINEKFSTNDVNLLAPINNPEKIIAVGLNYKDHCLEQNKPFPKEPMFFSKFASALVGPKDNVVAHSVTNKLDWEVELAIVIGKTGFKINKNEVYDYIFGYTVAQDISARDWQKERNGGQFLLGKSMDTFCPLGPAIVHKSLISDPQNLHLSCKVNGDLKQSSNTNNLIFGIEDIIPRLSNFFTLKPGDVILTGTPGGVGAFSDPPQFLKPGDIIESEIESVGKIINNVVGG